MFPCALVGPLFPPPPAPCHLYVPFLCVRPSCRCFFFVSVLALLVAPARPVCALCSSSCYPGPAALRPLSRLSPLPFFFLLSTLPARLPSLSVQRCHSRVPPLPLPLPLTPTLSPGCSLGPRLRPHPGCLAPCVGGGGVYLWSGLWPCTPHALDHSRELRYGLLIIVLQLRQ